MKGDTMSTRTSTVYPVLGCLQAIEDFLGLHKPDLGPCSWTPKTNGQQAFLKKYGSNIRETKQLDFLTSAASWQTENINRFLREHGFTIQLTPSDEPGAFAVACILDVLLKWIAAKDTFLQSGNVSYPAISIKGEDGVSAVALPNGNHLVSIRTKTDDVVSITMTSEPPPSVFGIPAKIYEVLEQAKDGYAVTVGSVTFPMVDLDVREDISFIVGLETGNGYYIHEALQQTKYRMNEEGARAQSAAAMGARCCMITAPEPKLNIIIDKPFLLWIRRPTTKLPVFSGYFEQDSWKRPANLD